MKLVAFAQGIYFLISGIWPILHMRSFLAVTGPKTDLWLVRTVGALLSVIGAAILVSARVEAIPLSIIVLAVGSAAALAVVDIVYVALRVIDKIFLLDAAAEIALIVAWATAWGLS